MSSRFLSPSPHKEISAEVSGKALIKRPPNGGAWARNTDMCKNMVGWRTWVFATSSWDCRALTVHQICYGRAVFPKDLPDKTFASACVGAWEIGFCPGVRFITNISNNLNVLQWSIGWINCETPIQCLSVKQQNMIFSVSRVRIVAGHRWFT